VILVADNNTIFIGKKPTENYVFSTIMLFTNGAGEVSIKARGMAIKRAVDVAEIVRNRMESMMKTKVTYSDIKIATEKVQREDGESNVSSIEIVLKK
jgi:DNA-binding protein